MKTIFETETCSRCHGTGKHSFCETYRDTCFKCHGSGITLTKRGYAAQQFFIDSCMVPVAEVKVGDEVKLMGVTMLGSSYWYRAKVVEISVQKDAITSIKDGISVVYDAVTITTECPKYGRAGLSSAVAMKVHVYRADDNFRLKKALEYQNTLTKAGTVRKSPKTVSKLKDDKI